LGKLPFYVKARKKTFWPQMDTDQHGFFVETVSLSERADGLRNILGLRSRHHDEGRIVC
jgi:hypothetical protein